jgi:hypothetical protein
LRRISWRGAPASYSKSNRWEIWSSFLTTISLYKTLLAPWIIILTFFIAIHQFLNTQLMPQ